MIDFWLSIGSTYTYLTVMRLAEVQRNNDRVPLSTLPGAPAHERAA